MRRLLLAEHLKAVEAAVVVGKVDHVVHQLRQALLAHRGDVPGAAAQSALETLPQAEVVAAGALLHRTVRLVPLENH